MTTQALQILTPVGRLVGGDCFKPQIKDAEGKPLVIKTGPNAGQPRVSYFMAIAIPKTDVGYAAAYASIVNVAKLAFPTLFDAAGNCINPAFAFKVTDGDSQIPNGKNIKPCDREGYPGNWVMMFSDGFAPKCYTTGGAELITDPSMIKKGYFIRISGNIKGNGSMQQPGIYLNHNMVELVGHGEEIISGPDANAVFGTAPAALPAGASATPLASSTVLQQPALPGAAVNIPALPGNTAVTPAIDFVNGPAGAPAEVKYLDSNGNAFTVAEFEKFGFNAAMIAQLQRAP